MFQKMLVVDGTTGCVDFTIKMMIPLLYTFCLHFCLINIHIFDYPDSRLSGPLTEIPTSLDNRGSTVYVMQFSLETAM